MNGPEHYAESVRLLEAMEDVADKVRAGSLTAHSMTAVAPVAALALAHAQLATAAAILEQTETVAAALWNGRDTRQAVEVDPAWRRVVWPST